MRVFIGQINVIQNQPQISFDFLSQPAWRSSGHPYPVSAHWEYYR